MNRLNFSFKFFSERERQILRHGFNLLILMSCPESQTELASWCRHNCGWISGLNHNKDCYGSMEGGRPHWETGVRSVSGCYCCLLVCFILLQYLGPVETRLNYIYIYIWSKKPEQPCVVSCNSTALTEAAAVTDFYLLCSVEHL